MYSYSILDKQPPQVIPEYYENFNLEDVITPVKVDKLQQLLNETGYDTSKTNFLIKGFREGFPIEYQGPQNLQQRSRNLKLPGGENDKVILWNKVMKEVRLGRYAGPFTEIPFANFIQSPIGLVPKDNGRDVRLIFHLSYPRNGTSSVNYNTPKEKCRVKYPDFNKAIQLCLKAGKFCKLSKSDLSSAFRNLGIRKIDWKWLVMLAKSPIDQKIYYFIDKYLPFGASISCAHFQAFSDALAHIIRVKTGKDNVNYLDDFLLIALLTALCNAQVELFLRICEQINFPVSVDKTFTASSQMIFLGFLIDATRQMVMLPTEKINKGLELINTALGKPSKKITL